MSCPFPSRERSSSDPFHWVSSDSGILSDIPDTMSNVTEVINRPVDMMVSVPVPQQAEAHTDEYREGQHQP